ncbi:MAG TPA: glycosyltransferase family 2 protein [Bacteroidales bacterium]|nr:glycosyltransferase family 2 protein [Bacteroidales bacterium]
MIKTAVVILNWNGKIFLEKFLETVKKYSPADTSGIFIADNGSSDGSLNYIKKQHPGIRIIDLGKNHGFAEGYNRALEQIKADYYILLNSDIEVSKGWLEKVIDYMDNNPEVAACQPKILSYNSRDTFEYAGAAGGFIDKYGYPFCRGRIMNNIEKDKGQYNNIKQIFWASGACLFIRSSTWKESGGFDAEFFAHMEEIDLCWRLNNSGKKIMHIPSSEVFHVGGGTLSYDSPRKIYLNFRNNLYLLYKNLPVGKRRKILFTRMLLDGLAAIRFLLILKPGAFYSILKAHRDYYRNRNKLKKTVIPGDKDISLSCNKLIFNKSIVFTYFFRRKKRFTDLKM